MRIALWTAYFVMLLVPVTPGTRSIATADASTTVRRLLDQARLLAEDTEVDGVLPLSDQAHAQLWVSISLVSDAAALRLAILELHAAAQREYPRCDGYCPKATFYLTAVEAAIERLEAIGSPESAAALVELWVDPGANWGAHTTESLAIAIVNSGGNALPHLKRYASGGTDVEYLIAAIADGRRFSH